MKALFTTLAIAAASVILAPAQASAQAYEDIIASQPEPGTQQRRSNGEAEATSMYGEAQVEGGEDYAEGQQDSDVDASDGDETSLDQAAIGDNGPQDIYSYIEQGRALGPTAQRDKDAKRTAEALADHRAAVVKKMKLSSEMLMQKQKERAWKLSHPGQEYSKQEDGETVEGGDDEESYSDDNGNEKPDGDDAGGEGDY